jgi:carbonic anhydrase
MKRTPFPPEARQALQRLKQGNLRFVKMRAAGKSPAHKDANWLQVKPSGPFATILSCSDSRAPAEILFDQGLGDLFVIRVAGNIVAPSLVGSVEFAAATTQAKLVVVMGHTECGAVRATLDEIDGTRKAPTQDLQSIVSRIRPHIERIAAGPARPPRGTSRRDHVWRESVRANVLASTDHLRHGSQLLEEMVRQGKIAIVGAEYCIETGLVDFFDNPMEPRRKKKSPSR